MGVEVVLGLLVATAVSGIVPLVNAELVVIAAAAALPALAVPIVALTAAVGQMTSKTAIYGVARWAPAHLPRRAREAMKRARNGVEGYEGATGSLVFASASLGMPPFYGVSIVAGALKVRLATFVGLGFLGRALRFGVLAWGANEATRAFFGTVWAALGPGGSP